MSGATLDVSPYPEEQDFIDCIERGDRYWPTQTGAKIRAELLRHILLGLSVELPNGAPRRVQVLAAGVRIGPGEDEKREIWKKQSNDPAYLPANFVTISGELDLSGLSRGGEPLPPLELTYCCFEDARDKSGKLLPVNLRGTRISRVSFEGSRFSALTLAGAYLYGTLDLSRCGPLPTPALQKYPFRGELFKEIEGNLAPTNGRTDWVSNKAELSPCVVDLESVYIEGDLRLDYSNFSIAKEKNPFSSTDEALQCAILVNSAYIRDSVSINQCVILGGIAFNRSHVEEDLWISGSRIFGQYLDNNYIDSFQLQLVTIGGLFVFGRAEPEPFGREGFIYNVVVGRIFGIGLRAREIWIGGGVFVDNIYLPKCDVEQSVTFGSYSKDDDKRSCVDGEIDLSSANVGKNVEFHDVQPNSSQDFLRRHKEEGKSFYDAVLGGLWDVAESYMRLKGEGLSVGRRIYITRSSFLREPGWPAPEERKFAVDLWKASIGTSLQIEKTKIEGVLSAEAASIGRYVDIARCDIRAARQEPTETYAGNAIPAAVELRQAQVGGLVAAEGHRP